MVSRALTAAVIVCSAGASADAAIKLTFDDPSTAREMRYSRSGVGPGGSLSYSPNVLVDLVVDATEDSDTPGQGLFEFAARLTIDIDVGTSALGVLAPISGTFFFEIEDEARGIGSFVKILEGTFSEGSLIGSDTAGAVLTSTAGGLSYETFGPLATDLAALGIGPIGENFSVFDAAFTLTEITPAISTDETDSFRSFTANSAFTGTINIPTPASAGALGACSLLALGRRRRR